MMVLCVKCKKDDPTSSVQEGDHFCVECFQKQMYERYRVQISKSREHRGQRQRILLEWDSSFKSEVLLYFATLIWKLEPNRKMHDAFYISSSQLGSSGDVLDSPYVKEATASDVYDRVYSAESTNDLAKRFMELTCRGEAEEIATTLHGGHRVFPLLGMTDEELRRMHALVFPHRPLRETVRPGDPLAALVGDFLERLGEEKASTASIVLKTCTKFSIPNK